jgi:KipI family sensor histidine kinase inhibitor
MKVLPASDSSLLVVFGNTISPELHDRVIALFRAVEARNHAAIRNLHPGYASLLIDFDPLQITHAQMESLVQELSETSHSQREAEKSVVIIPVCYDPEFGPDLADVASHAKLSPDEVIRQHSGGEYFVYFLGFSPGFAYLGGLPSTLYTPRLATPRKLVAAGSVGIAGSQTGIYPVDSPGGWRLIGRTPSRMFDPQGDPPTRLQPGDRVRFSVIDRARFSSMSELH